MSRPACCICGADDVPHGQLAHAGCAADELDAIFADEADWTGWLTPAELAAIDAESARRKFRVKELTPAEKVV